MVCLSNIPCHYVIRTPVHFLVRWVIRKKRVHWALTMEDVWTTKCADMTNNTKKTIKGAYYGFTNATAYPICKFTIRQLDGDILPVSHHMNHHLLAGISYQLTNLCQLACFKPPTKISLIFERKWLSYWGRGACRNKCRMLSFG